MQNTHSILSFSAVFNPSVEGGYDVSFLDFPGCYTFGATLEEAKEKAAEVLRLWIEELANSDETIPTHSRRPIVDQVNIMSPGIR